MPKGQKGPGFTVKQAKAAPQVIVVRISKRADGMQVTVRGSEDQSEVIDALSQALDLLSGGDVRQADSAQLDLRDAA